MIAGLLFRSFFLIIGDDIQYNVDKSKIRNDETLSI